jgi:hypothetical protein
VIEVIDIASNGKDLAGIPARSFPLYSSLGVPTAILVILLPQR